MKSKYIAVILVMSLLFSAGCDNSNPTLETENDTSPGSTHSITDSQYFENTRPSNQSQYPPFTGIDISEEGLKFSTINNKSDCPQIFCSGNGIVYYSNPLDGLRLYSYDGERTSRLSDIQAFSLNYYDGSVYFLSSETPYSLTDRVAQYGTLYKYDTASGGINEISDISMGRLRVDGEGIYYTSDNENGTYVYKADIESGTSQTQYRGFSVQHFDGYSLINQAREDGIDYFLQKGQEKIWLMSDAIALFDCMDNGVYYYRDYNDKYSLYSLDMKNGEKKLLYGESGLDDYTVFAGNIYLSVDGRLYKILQDGSLDLYEFGGVKESSSDNSSSSYQTVNLYADEETLYALITYMEGKNVVYAFARLDISEQNKSVSISIME